MDVETIHLDHIPSIEASSMMMVPLTDIGPYSSEHNTLPATATPCTTALRPTIDTVLPREILIKESEYSTYNCQLPNTLTLYTPMVVPCMDMVLLEKRVMGDMDVDGNSTYNPQPAPTLTLYTPIVVS